MNKEDLLAEVDDLIRNVPDRATIHHETEGNMVWMGRVSAVLEAWDMVKGVMLAPSVLQIASPMAAMRTAAYRKVMVALHQARANLRMETIGPVNVAVEGGATFDYFDEIRRIAESATGDLFFVDPYLDAEFVSRYLVHVASGVNIRLLAREKLKTLIPAVETFVTQHGTPVLVRTVGGFHDRYVIVDGSSCYQSGASFKDGAKKSPTTLTQITDAFPAVLQTYEALWDSAELVI